jgi:hypothetical protein
MVGEVSHILGKMKTRAIAKPTIHVAQTTRQAFAAEIPSSGRRSWWRVAWLLLLLLLSVALYVLLINVAPALDAVLIAPFLQVWILCFVPYVAACLFVLLTKPTSGSWRWVELGIIFAGALAFRVMVLSLPPNLSHDSWRYLWDARVTLHGYSPYVYVPWDKVFLPLRDFIYDNSRFRNVPTIYPPGAQAVYLLSYLLAPSNLFFLKGIFIVFDMVTCGALALLLARRGLDPRRMIIYAWCPLPVVEFAIQGHMDVVTLMFMMLAVLCAPLSWRGSQTLTGFLIGMATLTKIYPIFLLVVIMRRRDWPLLCTCLATIIVGYIPFLVLGQGQVLGYFATYSGEQGGNAGVVQLVIYSITHSHGFPLATIITIERIVDVMVVFGMSLVVLVLRLLKVGVEATILLMIGTILAISSHVFPWYTTVLLPWIALLIGPVWTRQGLNGKGLAVLMAWYFAAASLAGYFFNDTLDWHVYYWSVYVVVMAGLGIALTVGMWRYVRDLHKLKIEGIPK